MSNRISIRMPLWPAVRSHIRDARLKIINPITTANKTCCPISNQTIRGQSSFNSHKKTFCQSVVGWEAGCGSPFCCRVSWHKRTATFFLRKKCFGIEQISVRPTNQCVPLSLIPVQVLEHFNNLHTLWVRAHRSVSAHHRPTTVSRESDTD